MIEVGRLASRGRAYPSEPRKPSQRRHMPTSRPNDAGRILKAILPERENGQCLEGWRQIAAT